MLGISNSKQLIIFDLDDTIIDSHQAFERLLKDIALEQYQISLTTEQIDQNWGLPVDKYLRALFGIEDTSKMIELIRIKNQEEEYKRALLTGVRHMLDQMISRGIKLSILSGGSGLVSRPTLEDLLGDYDKYFDSLYFSEDTEPYYKPDSRVFGHLISNYQSMQIFTDRMLYIGDSLVDGYAAHGAGIDFIGVTTGLTSIKQFEDNGFRAVNNLADLKL